MVRERCADWRRRSLGEGDLFIPVLQNNDTLLFGDLRGMFDSRSAVEGNFGVGLRHMLPSGWNLGGYGYYDLRRPSYGNTFHQLMLGAEALGEAFDLRANTDLPMGGSEVCMALGSGSWTGSLEQPGHPYRYVPCHSASGGEDDDCEFPGGKGSGGC